MQINAVAEDLGVSVSTAGRNVEQLMGLGLVHRRGVVLTSQLISRGVPQPSTDDPVEQVPFELIPKQLLDWMAESYGITFMVATALILVAIVPAYFLPRMPVRPTDADEHDERERRGGHDALMWRTLVRCRGGQADAPTIGNVLHRGTVAVGEVGEEAVACG